MLDLFPAHWSQEPRCREMIPYFPDRTASHARLDLVASHTEQRPFSTSCNIIRHVGGAVYGSITLVMFSFTYSWLLVSNLPERIYPLRMPVRAGLLSSPVCLLLFIMSINIA